MRVNTNYYFCIQTPSLPPLPSLSKRLEIRRFLQFVRDRPDTKDPGAFGTEITCHPGRETIAAVAALREAELSKTAGGGDATATDTPFRIRASTVSMDEENGMSVVGYFRQNRILRCFQTIRHVWPGSRPDHGSFDDITHDAVHPHRRPFR